MQKDDDMSKDELKLSKKALARIAKICKDNIKAFGKDYQPKFPSGAAIKGARKEADGVVDACTEILNEIKSIRKEMKHMYW